MAYIPYYKPADGRLGNQANPGYGGMAAGAAANSLRTASQAMAFIQEKAGNQIEKINKIEDDGAASGYKIKVNDINAQLQAKIAADPFAFDKHLKWADDAAAKIRELKPKFNNPELAARYGGNQQEEDAQVLLINTAKGVQTGKIRIGERNWKAEMQMYADRGDRDGVIQVARRGEGIFATSEEINALVGRQEKGKILDECNRMILDEPSKLYDMIQSGGLDKTLNPMEKEEYIRRLRAGRDDVLRDGFYKSFVMEKASSSKKGEDIEPEYTGLFTEQEARWYRYKKAGRLNEVIDEINRAAAVEARAFNPNWNDIDMAVRKQQYIKRYEMLGLEKEFLNSQWSAAETERKNLKSKTIDTERILDRIQNTGLLMNETTYRNDVSNTYQYENKRYNWDKGGELRERFKEIVGIKDSDSYSEAFSKYDSFAKKSIADNLRGRISEEFNAWRSTQEGIDASPVRQQEAMFSIARRLTGNQDLGLDNDARNLDDAALQMEQLQENKFLQWVNSNKATIPVSDVFGSMEKPQAVTLGFDAKQKDLPEGILLPKSMMEGFDKENGVVEATFDNKHYRRFRVVGTCEGDTPKMSYAIARKGYYDLRNTYPVNMSIRNGNTDALMKEQELKKKVKSTSSLIIGNEARRDKNGNLTVYKLPAGDGGGTHEIAGINNGSHPQEFSKLKEMLDSGKYQEAEDEAQRYIASYTKPVGDVLQSAGVQSSGIDYFLRDMYFNGGEYGAARVVHRALGIPDSRKFGQGTIQAIKEYLSSHSEGDLLNALRDSREGLYRSIAANNPEKRKFLQGWINRNNNAYGQASNMA